MDIFMDLKYFPQDISFLIIFNKTFSSNFEI